MQVSGRTWSDAETPELRDTLHASTAAIWAEVAFRHPRFEKLARELSPEGPRSSGLPGEREALVG